MGGRGPDRRGGRATLEGRIGGRRVSIYWRGPSIARASSPSPRLIPASTGQLHVVRYRVSPCRTCIAHGFSRPARPSKESTSFCSCVEAHVLGDPSGSAGHASLGSLSPYHGASPGAADQEGSAFSSAFSPQECKTTSKRAACRSPACFESFLSGVSKKTELFNCTDIGGQETNARENLSAPSCF